MRYLKLAAVAAIVCAGAAHAAEAPSGVISYPATTFPGATTAYDMVTRAPGFTFDKGAVVRGLEGSGGNVLVDGETPVSKNDTLDEVLRRIPAGSVAHIDVVRGGAPGIDMQGRTVVVNVVRKSAAGFHGALSANLWFLADHRVLTGVRGEGQWRWDGKLLELAAVLGKGPDDLLGRGSRVRVTPTGAVLVRSRVEGDGGGTREWVIGAFETPLQGGRLRINGAILPNPYSAEITDRLSVPGGKEYEYDTQDKIQGELGARYTRNLGAKSSLEAVAFQQWNNNDTKARFTSPAVSRNFELDKQVSESVGRALLRHRLMPTLSVEGYLEGALNTLDSRTTLVQNAVNVRLPAANVQVEEKRVEASAKARWQATSTLTAEAQVRRESSTISSAGDVVLEKTLAFTKPKLAFTWSPDPQNQLRLRFEREVTQLNFDDFIASSSLVNTGALLAGNPDLAPQKAWVGEVEFEHRFWTSGVASVGARHYELTDVIDRAPVGSGANLSDAPGNIGAGTKDEVTAAFALPLAKFGLPAAQLKAQATWRWSQVTDPVTHRNREISILHPVDWEAHFTQALPAQNANWGMDVTGAFRERAFRLTEIETKKVDTWIVVYYEAKLKPDLIFRAELQNLGQRDSKRIRDVYLGPRNLAGLSYTDDRDFQYGQQLLVRLRKVL